MNLNTNKLHGAGLGYRREMSSWHSELFEQDIDFVEVAPENWMRLGGRFARELHSVAERFPLSTHGLSLSIGSPDPLDLEFVKELKVFLDTYNVVEYTEHLSYCSADGHMYDLMPIPFTLEAAQYVADRIKRVQDVLERQIAIENVSYYLAPGQEMSELEFTLEVLERADCKLLFDVNNVYVNSINHNYDAKDFIAGIPSSRILYGHIAGHYDEADDLKVDTHGSTVKTDVWQLLQYAYQRHGVFPTLLERDFNIPELPELMSEVSMIRQSQELNVNSKTTEVA